MALSVGTKAPDFTLSTKAADGPKQITLSDHFGKGNTLLLFFPMAFTGTCTTEMCGVSMDLSAYGSLNATVYGHQRRQSVRAGSLGAEGENFGAAAERLRASRGARL
jgi:peroxiredoxin